MSLRRHPDARVIAGNDCGLLSLLDRGTGLHATPAGIGPGDDPNWIYVETGGTTGVPKTVRRSAESWLRSFRVNARLFDVGPHARVACFGALSHSLSLYAMCEGAGLGAGLLPLGGMRPDRQARLIGVHRATHLWVTPAQLRQIARFGPFDSAAVAMIGGGALGTDGRSLAARTFPNARIVPFYGTSEASFVTLGGKPYPGVEIDIVDGAIRIRSSLVFDGYATGADPHVVWNGDWLEIGERGRWGDNDDLQVLGRTARLVNVADALVSPEITEKLLCRLAGLPVAVVAQPDIQRGQVLVAFVEGPPDPARDTRLLTEARRVLGPRIAPRRMFAIDLLPLLSSGKVDLAALERLSPVPG